MGYITFILIIPKDSEILPFWIKTNVDPEKPMDEMLECVKEIVKKNFPETYDAGFKIKYISKDEFLLLVDHLATVAEYQW